MAFSSRCDSTDINNLVIRGWNGKVTVNNHNADEIHVSTRANITDVTTTTEGATHTISFDRSPIRRLLDRLFKPRPTVRQSANARGRAKIHQSTSSSEQRVGSKGNATEPELLILLPRHRAVNVRTR